MNTKKSELRIESDEYRELFYRLVYHKLGTPNQKSNGTSGQTGTTTQKK